MSDTRDIVERLRLRCALELDEQYLCDAIECEAADEIDRLRSEIARLREERRWVPVGERLPEIDVPVWVRAVRRGDYGYTEDEVCMTVATLGRHYSEPTPTWRETVPAARHSMGITVTHWQPLPPGPEAE